MQQFQTGQRVIIRAMDESGAVQEKPLYGFAAVVGSYPELNPEASDKVGRESQYMLATLNKDLEVNIFTGYIDAKCLTLLEGEPLVTGLLEEWAEVEPEQLIPDESGEVFVVIRDDLDGNEFNPDEYEGDLQLVRVSLDGNEVAIWPAESLAVAANNLRRLVGESLALSSLEGLLIANPNPNATEEERATFIPEADPESELASITMHRPAMVEMGLRLIDFTHFRVKEEMAGFVESCENLLGLEREQIKASYFESPLTIIAELKEIITDAAEESRLTEGSDIELTFEPFIGNVSEWEDHGFDLSVEDESDAFEPEIASDLYQLDRAVLDATAKQYNIAYQGVHKEDLCKLLVEKIDEDVLQELLDEDDEDYSDEDRIVALSEMGFAALVDIAHKHEIDSDNSGPAYAIASVLMVTLDSDQLAELVN